MTTEKSKIGIILDQDPSKAEIQTIIHAIDVVDFDTNQADTCLRETLEKAKIKAAKIEVDLFK
ncbi:hypothetical protein A2291_05035 [candidate division WOR-1 bacterium RIFOXYB2_FULL_42_35]|uniref:Uncharacterized protein n=1 Tax=candidate division WOR-1 bacterium RIFOXYC2_FULL_41_25 TaxID=1802586 RepID=A0A1F4TMX8_UNCSA|nr:MAG: hypothetical protein A2247_00455 [candidate division WOR-1 bacterium RIFOXYA2_FULL_41_14]OGC24465.1 MAG: hypothetical protein A2291_05035 [candidate division WOR-1 bacterium RIFOXYB2_FULL_42_35]OGC34082.1 MAG: hypothetical protein A2462_00895 [candidate division WOR-1 bacterium RIFOXYC2_FULL_41_25]